MKSILNSMILLYKIENIDWMGFTIDKITSLTFHHIIKAENGGKYAADNGAILTKRAHDFLHCIEGKDIKIYNEINRLFKIINLKQGINVKDELEQIKFLILEYLDMGYDIPHNMKRNKIKQMIISNSNLF